LRPDDFRKLFKQRPFEPVRIGLSDGRSVLVRHPDQVVVAERHLLVGLAKLERSLPLATPQTADAIAKDWLIINLLHVAFGEPVNGVTRRRGTRKSQ
jgi:hypothetical protein